MLAAGSFSRALLLGTLAFGSVLAAGFVATLVLVEDRMERISLHHWLDAEAQRYAVEWRQAGAAAPLPNPLEFDVYTDAAPRPAWLDEHDSVGFHEHQVGREDKHFVVIEHPSGQGLLRIVFKDDADDYLDGYEDRLHRSGVVLGALTLAALVIASLWLTRRLVRPLLAVERKVAALTPGQEPISVDAPFVELAAIERALATAQREVALHVRREQEFSGFVSHELRTPLTIVQGSADTLARIGGGDARSARAVERIDQASRGMARLIDTFLMLGRDATRHGGAGHGADDGTGDGAGDGAGGRAHEEPNVRLDVAARLERVVQEQARTAGARRHWPLRTVVRAPLLVDAPEALLRVLLDNLVRNAAAHATGPIEVIIDADGLRMSNPRDGGLPPSRGHGYGLVICQRICERLGWRLETGGDAQRFTVRVRCRAESVTG